MSRYEKVQEALVASGHRGLGLCKGPNGSTLEFWHGPQGVRIVQVYADEHGVEVYAPLVQSNRMDDLIAAISTGCAR